jgi:hypothetical protein
MTAPQPPTEALHHHLAATAADHGITDLAVAAVITDHDQHTLLLRHNRTDDPHYFWDLPTGPVLPGHTIPDALEDTITTAGLTLEGITGYLGHHDTRASHRRIRTFLFAVTTTNPHRICADAGHHWAAPVPNNDHPPTGLQPANEPTHAIPGPASLDSELPLHAALRAYAHGVHPDEASIELLIGHDTFLRRPDFTDRFIEPGSYTTTDGTAPATINWTAAVTALDTGELPCSSGQQRILRLAASLGDGLPVSLRDTLPGIDAHGTNLIIAAVLHAAGQRPPTTTP